MVPQLVLSEKVHLNRWLRYTGLDCSTVPVAHSRVAPRAHSCSLKSNQMETSGKSIERSLIANETGNMPVPEFDL